MAEKMRQLPPHRNRPACRLSQLYPIVVADFWLVVAFPHPEEAIETDGAIALSFLFFRRSIRRPKRRVNVLYHMFSPAASPLKRTLHRRHHRSVDCCAKPSSSSHPRPVHPAILPISWWVPFGRPKQGYPTQPARTRALGACNGLIGGRGATIRAHGG
jgi:hypothetical protein